MPNASRRSPGRPFAVFAGSNFLHSIVSSGHISLVSLLLKFGIFGIIEKFEFNSDWRISGDSHRQAMAAILGDDVSLGQEAAEKVVEDFEVRFGPSARCFEGSQ